MWNVKCKKIKNVRGWFLMSTLKPRVYILLAGLNSYIDLILSNPWYCSKKTSRLCIIFAWVSSYSLKLKFPNRLLMIFTQSLKWSKLWCVSSLQFLGVMSVCWSRLDYALQYTHTDFAISISKVCLNIENRRMNFPLVYFWREGTFPHIQRCEVKQWKCIEKIFWLIYQNIPLQKSEITGRNSLHL